MRKRYFLCIIFIFIFSSFSGCMNEQSNNQNLITVPLESLSLTLKDLPEGYSISNIEPSSEEIQGITETEFFGQNFLFTDPLNDTGYPWIGIHLYKFQTTKDAVDSIQYLSEKQNQTMDESKRNTPLTVEPIGNESIYDLFLNISGTYYKSTNATFSFIYFRLENVVVYLFLEGIPNNQMDYTLKTIEYAKIIENNISEN